MPDSPSRDEEKLEPCPFCGGEAQLDRFGQPTVYQVKCGVCAAAAHTIMGRVGAIDAWNRRLRSPSATPDTEWRGMLTAFFEVVPEFDDDVDETGCPDGFVTCRVCDGGGHRDARKRLPPKHKPGCVNAELRAILAAPLPEPPQ